MAAPLRQKPNGIWVVDFEEDGKRRRVSTGTKDKAQARIRAREIVNGIDVRPAPGEAPPTPGSDEAKGLTMAALFDLCCTGSGPWTARKAKSQATIKSNLKVLRPLIGDVSVAAVTYKKLEEVQETLFARGYKGGTVRRKMDMVGRALTFAVTQDLITARPPMPSITVDNARTRVLQRDEESMLFQLIEARILAEPARPWQRFGYLLRFLLDTGCRLGEAVAVEVGWIESHQGRPVVHIPAHATKTNKARVLPLSQAIVDALPFLRITAVAGRLFPMLPATAWYMFGNLKDEALLKHKRDLGDVVLHSMRHTCITRLLQGGMPLVKVSKWAGHANVKITAQVYGHLEVGDLMDGLDIIDSVPAPSPALKAVG